MIPKTPSTPVRTLFLSLALLAGCGGASAASETTTPSAIELLRQRAEANPSDPAVWSELAAAELLAPGGDHARVRPALDRALTLAPEAPMLALLSGWEREQHGDDAAALEAYLRALALARGSDDPRAAHVGEAALDSMAGLSGKVPRYQAQVMEALGETLDAPGRLGLVAVDAAAQRLIGLGLRRGDPALVEQTSARLACLTDFRLAGPFGPYVNLGFDTTLPAEGAGPLADRYDLGEGIGEEDTRDARHDGCAVFFDGARTERVGTVIAETSVEVAAEDAGPHLLSVETGASLKIRVDGSLVHAVDRRRVPDSSYTRVTLDLAAGTHEIELKLSGVDGSSAMTVLLDRPGSRGEGYDPARGSDLPEGDEVATVYLRAVLLSGRADPVNATETLRALAEGADATALTLTTMASFLEGHPYLPSQRKRARVSTLIRRATERDPDAVAPALARAGLEQGSVEKFEAMRAVAERWPGVVDVQMRWAGLLQGRGQEAEAEAIYRGLMERLPEDCAAARQLYRLLRERNRIREANALVERLMSCNESSGDRFQLLFRQRRWEEARAELERLRALVGDRDVRGAVFDLALATGDSETEARIRREVDEESPGSVFATRHAVDVALARGRRAEALTLLERAFAEDPAGMAELRELRRDLTGRDDLEPYRVDGARVIREFEASGRSYADQGKLLMFDYMVTRIYPDGSARHLVHQIYRVQSEEAIESLGQISLPGEILTLRSIKPDGRRLEPERIRGLDSIPMENLAIGDYVEYEYLAAQPPRLNGGFLSGGWVFQNFEAPFDHSQMVVVVPRDLDLVVEALGPVPEPEERREGDLRVLSWTVTQSPQLQAEPSAAPVPPILPSLRFGVHADWDSLFEAERDMLLSRDPVAPSAERLVAELLAGAPEDIEARVRVLHGWVMENIEPASGWSAMAPLMIEARQGSPTRVLHYLLELAGIEADFVFAPSFGSLQKTPLSRGDLYDTVMLRIPRGEGAALWVTALREGLAPDYIPAPTRGLEGIALVEGLPPVRVPDPGPAVDLQSIEVDVTPLSLGKVRVEVVETYRGFVASSFRGDLDRIPAAELERRLAEGYVSHVVPGAAMTALRIDGREDAEGPLVLRYTAEVEGFGRLAGGDWLLPPVMGRDLARTLASLPTRTTTLRVDGTEREVTVRVHGVPPSTPALAAVSLEGRDGARYTLASRLEGDTLVTERRLHLPRMLVPVDAYAAFARFCRDATEAEARETHLPLR